VANLKNSLSKSDTARVAHWIPALTEHDHIHNPIEVAVEQSHATVSLTLIIDLDFPVTAVALTFPPLFPQLQWVSLVI
jgi:hypothetical protein